MKHKTANPPPPLPTTMADDARMDIDRLVSKVPTHECRQKDGEQKKTAVPPGGLTRKKI
jgi:hypothetical protein